MILAATLLWAVEVVVAKWLLAGVSSWTVGVARMGFGSIALLCWLGVRGQLGALASLTGEQLGWVARDRRRSSRHTSARGSPRSPGPRRST